MQHRFFLTKNLKRKPFDEMNKKFKNINSVNSMSYIDVLLKKSLVWFCTKAPINKKLVQYFDQKE